jgi:hypothetical protein
MAHKIDLFSIFIFTGIVQAVFLCLFFFSKGNRKVKANFFQGVMIGALAACCLEILFCYTGFIVNALWMVDYSEPLAFLIGPSFYLMIIALIEGKVKASWYLHFLPAVGWMFMQIPFFIQHSDVKYNAWIGAYHPAGLSYLDVNEKFFAPPFHSEFVLAHVTLYLVLGKTAILED